MYPSDRKYTADRDYSGGGSFFSRERVIAFDEDQFVWRDTTWTRVSAGELSSTASSHEEYAGTWTVTVKSGVTRLVLDDTRRGRRTYRLQEGGRGKLLLDGRPYSWSRTR